MLCNGVANETETKNGRNGTKVLPFFCVNTIIIILQDSLL